MTSPIYVQRRERGLDLSLVPAGQHAEDVIRKIPRNHVVEITIKRPRNIKHHRMFWALMGVVFENQSHYESKDHMVTALKVALGHCDTVICKDGNPAYIPKSISFAKMDQTAFNEFWDNCLHLVCKHFLPGADSENLTREVYRMIGEKMDGAMR